MSLNRWKMVAMPVVLLGLASPMLLNCGAIKGKGKLDIGGGVIGDVVEGAQGCDEFDKGDIASLDFSAVPGLSNEIRQKLIRYRPSTLAQASRIDGMTPAALMLILAHIRKASRAA